MGNEIIYENVWYSLFSCFIYSSKANVSGYVSIESSLGEW